MARSRVDLANAALGYLVRDTIRTLDGSSPSAILTKQFMDQSIEAVLEEYDWPYCRVVKKLDLTSGINARGWTFVYIAPSDAVKVWRVSDPRGTEYNEYEFGYTDDVTRDENYVYTNKSDAYIRYSSGRASLDRYSPGVFELFGLKLAEKCCMPLTKDAKLHQYLRGLFRTDLSRIKTLTALSEPEFVETEETPELIRIRQGG